MADPSGTITHVTSSSTSEPTVTPPPALPLAWTRIQRKRPRLDDAGNVTTTSTTPRNTSINDELCCDDPSCQRTVPSVHPTFTGVTADTATSKAMDEAATTATKTVQGKVVFLLPDTNPSWCQGYLFFPSQSKPWGLLAVQTDLDECLQCADGGYRQIRLKVSTYNAQKDILDFQTVEWFGGDMMRLVNETVRMTPMQLSTGKAAIPFCEGIFGSLLRQLRMQTDDTAIAGSPCSTVLEMLPDVAVIVGSMELVVPAGVIRDDAVILDEDSVCE